MKEERHVIWSNYGLDYEDWRDDLEADYPDLSEDERISLMYEINGDYLDDERANLNVQLSQPILVVGDLGLWNGRRMGYKEIPSGNIRDCLYARQFSDEQESVESVVLHKLEVDRLHTALSLLTPEERALIQALFFDERKESELAVELGISQPAVYKRKMKILKKLKIFLEK